MREPLSLECRSYIVTGASSGLGRATARVLADLGARLALLARDEERLDDTLGALSGEGHVAYVQDLRRLEAVPDLVRKVAKDLGPLSGLFHAAGEMAARPLRASRPEDLLRLMEVSVLSAHALVRALSNPGNIHPDGGSVVLMSSVAGLRGKQGLAAYSASKGAVDAMVRSLACELAAKRMRVNSIAAGAVETEMHKQVVANLTADACDAYRERHLLGFGTPEDVAYAVAFLLSDMARWVTGTTMVVDGGYMCH